MPSPMHLGDGHLMNYHAIKGWTVCCVTAPNLLMDGANQSIVKAITNKAIHKAIPFALF